MGGAVMQSVMQAQHFCKQLTENQRAIPFSRVVSERGGSCWWNQFRQTNWPDFVFVGGVTLLLPPSLRDYLTDWEWELGAELLPGRVSQIAQTEEFGRGGNGGNDDSGTGWPRGTAAGRSSPGRTDGHGRSGHGSAFFLSFLSCRRFSFRLPLTAQIEVRSGAGPIPKYGIRAMLQLHFRIRI